MPVEINIFVTRFTLRVMSDMGTRPFGPTGLFSGAEKLDFGLDLSDSHIFVAM